MAWPLHLRTMRTSGSTRLASFVAEMEEYPALKLLAEPDYSESGGVKEMEEYLALKKVKDEEERERARKEAEEHLYGHSQGQEPPGSLYQLPNQ